MLTRYEFEQEAREAIYNALKEGYSGYLCDLHNEVFNTDYYEVYTSRAKDWFDNFEDDVFSVIAEVVNYETSNFGDVNTDISNPCAVLNMFWYIIGEEVFNNLCSIVSDEIDYLWNVELNDNECKMLLAKFKEYDN